MRDTGNEGLVLKNYGGFYYIQDEEDKIIACRLRGKVKTQVLSGDRVYFTKLSDDTGILEKVLPRDNELIRPRIANVSLVLIVMSYDKPAPSLYLLDRLLFLAFYHQLKPVILLNKCDLIPENKVLFIQEYYLRAGFDLIHTSAVKKQGLEEVRTIIKDNIAVFAGPSGAGKSSLLNALLEGVNMKTQEVSNKIGRGRHTTRHVELFPLSTGGFLADTPGFSVVSMPQIERQKLAHFFPDFLPFISECRFRDCIHFKEESCGVQKAQSSGLIAESRYENYLSMLQEVIENERCYR
ncbi:MAG: ribosome small subunit-dependent GTPase A [Syntrophomonadaceae bacterium]|jgi:ribosome biogenesis GTPase